MCMPSVGLAWSSMAYTGCPRPTVNSACGEVLFRMNQTYLAFPCFPLASLMGLVMQRHSSKRFLINGGPGCMYLGELSTTAVSFSLTRIKGEGEHRQSCRRGEIDSGEGEWM